MTNIWLVSDTHFGHANILNFGDYKGDPIRRFDSIDDHDAMIRQLWSDYVRPDDIVYHLGDVAMHKRHIPQMSGLPGRKRLLMGNHDDPRWINFYREHFQKIAAYRDINVAGKRVVMSHIPIHMGDDSARWNINIHGHLHENQIDDQRYVNVCPEIIGYAPINIEDAVKRASLKQSAPAK
jgi:calcineurin-like phosphoesterase family protein